MNTSNNHNPSKPPVFTHFMPSFPRAIEYVSWIARQGEKKHGDVTSWQSCTTIEEHLNSLGRHLIDHADNESHDPESGMPHLAHVAWRAMAALELYVRDYEEDVAREIEERDRYVTTP